MDNESWTIGSLLQWTTDYLRQHGSETARLDAEVLLAEAHGCRRIDLYTAYEEIAHEPTRVAYRELVQRRAEGAPVAYLVGRREFYSHIFRVTPDVLIPRPETEFVLVALLDLVKQRETDAGIVRIVDVGTGSGVLAICAALHIPNSQVTAIDISPAALEIARTNAAEHHVDERIEFREGDLLSNLPTDHAIDYIISNPPYVRSSEWESLAPDIRDYEPRVALLAGDKGTEIIARLVAESSKRLNPDGWLILEVSPVIVDDVSAIITREPGFSPPRIVKDLSHQPRVVMTQRQKPADRQS